MGLLFSSTHIAARSLEVLWATLILVNKVVQREGMRLGFILYSGIHLDLQRALLRFNKYKPQRTSAGSDSVDLRWSHPLPPP